MSLIQVLPPSGNSCPQGVFLKTPPADSRQTHSSRRLSRSSVAPEVRFPAARLLRSLPAAAPPQLPASPELSRTTPPPPHASDAASLSLFPSSFPMVIPDEEKTDFFFRSARRRPFPGPPRRCDAAPPPPKLAASSAALSCSCSSSLPSSPSFPPS